jgi:hypothetical protein
MPHAGEPVARNYVIATFGKGSLEGLLQVRILERKSDGLRFQLGTQTAL